MAAAAGTIISVPIYQINSNQVIDRNLYPFGKPVLFGVAGLVVQPNSGVNLVDLQAGRQAGGALIYSVLKSSATGDTVFFSNLTVAQILTLAT